MRRLKLEPLESRLTPAVTAVVTGTTLEITGDAADDTIAVTDDGGLVKVNDLDPAGGPADSADITAVIVNAGGGSDSIDLSAVDAAAFTSLTSVEANGESGDDLITGSPLGDTLTGGAGDDTAAGGAGDDTLIWDDGDGSDVLDGGDGSDAVQLNGDPAAGDDILASDGDGGRFDIARGNLTEFSLDVGTAESLEVNGLGGDDAVTLNLSAGLVGTIDVAGGDGDDSLTGTAGADRLDGGAGNDTIVGAAGDDSLIGGGGNDLTVWNNGDGSDAIDGGIGTDTTRVNGGDGLSENFALQAGGVGVEIRRVDPNPFALSLTAVEAAQVNGQGGDDTINAAGLDAGLLLAAELNGGPGNDSVSGSGGPDRLTGGDGSDALDGGPGGDTLLGDTGDDTLLGGAGSDSTIWNNGDGSDLIDGGGDTDVLQVNGAPLDGDDFVATAGGDRFDFARQNLGPFSLDVGTTERLEVNGQGGDDTVNAAGLDADFIDASPFNLLRINGGQDNDVLVGGGGPDTITGGTGDDSIVGSAGGDTLIGDVGDDTIVWNNGDGSDLIEGGAGTDTVQVNAAAGGYDFTVLPAGGRVAVTRNNLGQFALDVGSAESIDLNTLGGDDTVRVEPSPAAALDLDGGDGTDGLQVDLNGAADPSRTGVIADDPATVTFSNREDVTLTDFESARVGGGPPAGQNTTGLTAVGADVDGPGTVTVLDGAGNTAFTLDAFPGGTGGVRAAAADLTGDGVPDIVAVNGPQAGASQFVIFDGATRQQIGGAVAPFGDFSGGLFVSAADFDGDGTAEFVITPDVTGGPRVAVFSLNGGAAGRLIPDFFGIDDPDFRGGARAAAGDIDGDGTADLVVAAGVSGGPRVALFDGASLVNGVTDNAGKLVGDFFVFEQSLRDGAFVALGDFAGDGFADLVVGSGPGGGPRVRVFGGRLLATAAFDANDPGNTAGVQLANFFAFADGDSGARVAAKRLDGDGRDDLVVGGGRGAGQSAVGFLAADTPENGSPSAEAFNAGVFDEPFGVFVG